MAYTNPNYSLKPSSDIFKAQIMQIASTIVWKNGALAKGGDKTVDMYHVETFMAAKKGMLNFMVIDAFDEEILQQMGYTGEKMVSMLINKNNIPEDMRDKAVELYVKKLTKKDPLTGHYVNYFEENNYYRMLTGLPDVDDKEFVYVTKYNTPWPMDIPVHQMTMTQRLEIEKSGYLDELIQAHPKKKYLKYIGKKGIDIFAARGAERFDMLYYESDGGTFEHDFKDLYYQNRYAVNAVYYSAAFKFEENKLYENFLAMSLLFMTVEQMFHKYLHADITRDFYDVESIRYIYASYSVPFYQEIPLEVHTRIVKAMNILLSYHGSPTVFFDLFDLFGASATDINAYYITKAHRFKDGKPYFPKKADGTIDNSAAYDIAFSKVKLYQDPALETIDPSNRINYWAMTNNDPYWVNDKELLDKLDENMFNYTESKYIGIQTVLDILGATYQNSYFFKMIQDNREDMQKIQVRWAATNIYVSLFDFFIYLACLYCKKYNFDGALSDDLAFTATVLGYDFKNHVIHLQNLILQDDTLQDDTELINLIRKMDTESLASVNETFKAIKDLRKLLVERFSHTHDRDEYLTYRNLYDTLLTSQNIKDSFTKSTGEMASSYADMLSDSAPNLYQRFLEINEDTIDDEIRLIINQLEEAIPSIQTLHTIFNLDINSLIESLLKMLKFFKSAKAELVGYKIVYVMSLRGVNFFKLLDKIVHITESSSKGPTIMDLTDLMECMKEHWDHINDMIHLLEDERGDEHFWARYEDELNLMRELIHLIVVVGAEPMKANVEYTDFLMSCITESFLCSLMPLSDENFLLHEEFLEPKYHGIIKDHVKFLTDELILLGENTENKRILKSAYYLQDLMEKILNRLEKQPMNTVPLFMRDELTMISWILIGADDYLSLMMKQVLEVRVQATPYTERLRWRDSFILKMLVTLLPLSKLTVQDVLSFIGQSSEFIDRVRLGDDLQEIQTKILNGALRDILWWRDKISEILEEVGIIESENIIPFDELIARVKDKVEMKENATFSDELELISFKKNFHIPERSNFPFVDNLSASNDRTVDVHVLPYQKMIFYLNDFVPYSLDERKLPKENCVLVDRIRLIKETKENESETPSN